MVTIRRSGNGVFHSPSDDFDDPGILELSPDAEREVVEAALDAEIEAAKDARANLYAMLREAGRLLRGEAVAHCCQKRLRDMEIQIYKSCESGRTFYTGIARCGSVWHCPLCSIRIVNGRRKELQEASRRHVGNAGRIYLLTLTIRHHRGNDLKILVLQILAALKKMQNRSFWRSWRNTIGLQGSVRALEVTHGLNGWHVHIHTLLFCDGDGTLTTASDLLPAWKSACTSSGLPEPNERGVDIRLGDQRDLMAAYVAKWGIETELTAGLLNMVSEKTARRFSYCVMPRTAIQRQGVCFKNTPSLSKGSISWSGVEVFGRR